MRIISKLLNFFSKSQVIDEDYSKVKNTKKVVSKYEKQLYKKFGNVDFPNKKLNLRIMVITDTHDTLYYHKEMQEYIKNEPNIDLYLLLGDHSAWECDFFRDNIPNEKLYGIVGNHDPWERLTNSNITDINKKVITINGIRISGIAGSIKYKNGNYGMYTQEEAMQVAKEMPPADILISHDKPYLDEENDYVHNGLQAITYYLYKNKVPYHIHGHLHEEYEKTLLNGTKSFCVYKIKVLEL